MSVALCGIFFVSGVAALIFESLWFSLAGLMLGNSVMAAAIVLGAFMAGIAIGNFLTAIFGDRIKSPVKTFAWLQILIGLCGFLLVIFFPYLTRLLVPLYQNITKTPGILNIVRAVIIFLLMLIPTTAMGATLPVLVKALNAHKQNFGNSLGKLYGWNTLGAVLGVTVNEIFLVKNFGITGAGVCAFSRSTLRPSRVIRK